MIDYLHDMDGDIRLVNGDFRRGKSTDQHQKDILLTRRGSLKYAPVVGVGILDFILDDDPENLVLEVRKQFTRDGMVINSLELENGKLKTDAPYENS